MEFFDKLGAMQNSWLNEFQPHQQPWPAHFRRQALECFLRQGLPEKKEESWRYTNLDKIRAMGFAPTFSSSMSPAVNEFGEDVHTVVLASGQLESRLVKEIQAGVLVGPLSEMRKNECLSGALAKINEHELHRKEFSEERFECLNRSFSPDPLVLYFGQNISCEKPVVIYCRASVSKEAPDQFLPLISPRIYVLVEPGAKATIVEYYQGESASSVPYFTNSCIQLWLGSNSHLEYIKAQNEDLGSYHIHSLYSCIEEGAHLSLSNLSLGSQLARHNADIELVGPQSHVELNGAYMTQNAQHVDNRTNIVHKVGSTSSCQNYKGILADHSRAVFAGRIRIEPRAQKVESSQINKNLLLSDKCEVDTKPELEIYADDVKANHGATIGQLDPNQIFYLQSRGLKLSQATKILAHGFVSDLGLKINDPTVSSTVLRLIDQSIENLNVKVEDSYGS